jgi:hypothetical protein
MTMQPLRAHVRNGRLVLDEPTDLPEGEIVYLQPVGTDELDHEEQARLHEALRESIDQMKAGQTIARRCRASGVSTSRRTSTWRCGGS